MVVKSESLKKIKENIIEFENKILSSKDIDLTLEERKEILKRFQTIKDNVPCAHSSDELLAQTYYLLTECKDLEGDIVELGAYKGGSTAKLSIIAKKLGKKLYVFDSFEGLPTNEEKLVHTTMGYVADLNKGKFCGRLKEVKDYVTNYGEIDSCVFMIGWYEDILPTFRTKICAVSCDVDLFESTKTCLKYIYPQVAKDGFFFSQDCHFPLINNLFYNKKFWEGIGEYMPKLIQLTERFGYFKKLIEVQNR